MSKYIDSEKLIAEIEKWREKSPVSISSNFEDGWIDGRNQMIDDVLSIIASLQQEQPEADLENYLENYFKGWHIEEEIGLTKPDGWSCIVDDLKDVARHFYVLGLNARNEK